MPRTKINVLAKDAQDVTQHIADIVEHRARNEQNIANLTDDAEERSKAAYAAEIMMELARHIRENVIVTVGG